MAKSSYNKFFEINDIHKHFSGAKALSGCSFAIKKGTISVIIGPNGAGKSTLFNVISGLLRPDSGKIIFNNTDITKNAPEKIARLGISRVFQKARLFDNLTVRDNLLLALNNNETSMANLFGVPKNVAQKHMLEISSSLEGLGLTSSIDKIARDLSYGQQRLVEIVRAILFPHSILILDEPVNGVAQKLKDKIRDMLLRQKELGDTILMIEHNIDFAFSVADTVFVMDKGKIIAKGSPTSIRNNKTVIDAYFGN